MKKSNLTFKGDKVFVKKCVFDCTEYKLAEIDGGRDGYSKFIRRILRKAQNTDEFVDLYLAEEKYKALHAYQILLENHYPEKVWLHIRKNFGDKSVKTWSDAGGVKVGTKDFYTIVSNRRGDGITRVAVFENKDDFCCSSLMLFDTCFYGNFNIYACDCNCDEIIFELHGQYFVYVFNGLVAFVKYN